MKAFLLFILLSFSFSSFSQMTTKDQLEIEIRRARPVANASLFQTSLLKVKSSELQKVMVKIKIRSGETRANLSGFSLLDPKNKIRYRLADYKGYAGIIGYPEYIPYRKTQYFTKSGLPVNWHVPFKLTVPDLFEEYPFEGYTDFEVPVNFGSSKEPKLSIVYFGVTRFKNFTAELFFTLPTANTGLEYYLYYKDEKVGEISF